MKKVSVLIFVLMVSFEVRAEFDGNELLRQCGPVVKQLNGEKLNPDEQLESLLCAGYLSGFTDSHAIETPSQPRPLYCFPKEGIEVGQQARIVVKYLRENPEILHESARSSIAISFTHAFPCRSER